MATPNHTGVLECPVLRVQAAPHKAATTIGCSKSKPTSALATAAPQPSPADAFAASVRALISKANDDDNTDLCTNRERMAYLAQELRCALFEYLSASNPLAIAAFSLVDSARVVGLIDTTPPDIEAAADLAFDYADLLKRAGVA